MSIADRTAGGGLLALHVVAGRSQWEYAPDRVTTATAPPLDATASAAVKASTRQPIPMSVKKRAAAPAPTPPVGPPFEVRGIDGKGKGCFAQRALKLGERIIAETATARWKVSGDADYKTKVQSFADMSAGLSAAAKAEILSLSQADLHGERRTLIGTWLTNALPINYEGTSPDEEAAVTALPGTYIHMQTYAYTYIHTHAYEYMDLTR